MKQTVKKTIKSCKDWMEQPSDIKHIHYLNLSQEDVMEVRFKKAIKSALQRTDISIARQYLVNEIHKLHNYREVRQYEQ